MRIKLFLQAGENSGLLADEGNVTSLVLEVLNATRHFATIELLE